MIKWWLTEQDKYEITSYAFSYFMLDGMEIEDAIIRAVKVIRPDRIKQNGELRLSKSTLKELELRVKGLYK